MSNRMVEQVIVRDRPAQEPGGLECQYCGCIFVGEPWHQFCAICIEIVVKELKRAQDGYTI